jgi:hypothetical protein
MYQIEVSSDFNLVGVQWVALMYKFKSFSTCESFQPQSGFNPFLEF